MTQRNHQKLKGEKLREILANDLIDYGFSVLKETKGGIKRINPKWYLDRNPDLKDKPIKRLIWIKKPPKSKLGF